MFNIEKGVPVPYLDPRGREKGELRLTMEKLEVGDSFIVTEKLRCQVPNIARLMKIGYKTRRVGEDAVRVWRLS
jgi:hypothetical protein